MFFGVSSMIKIFPSHGSTPKLPNIHASKCVQFKVGVQVNSDRCCNQPTGWAESKNSWLDQVDVLASSFDAFNVYVQSGLVESVNEAILRCDPDQQPILYRNIVSIGGNVCYQNFRPRLLDGLRGNQGNKRPTIYQSTMFNTQCRSPIFHR